MRRSSSVVSLVVVIAAALVITVAAYIWSRAPTVSKRTPASRSRSATSPVGDPAARPHRPSGTDGTPPSTVGNLPAESMLGFVEIPAGPFLMGSDQSQDPHADLDQFWSKTAPGHQGTLVLPSFYIGRYEVTIAQFALYLDRLRKDPGDQRVLKGLDDHPVRYVSWQEAIEYCQWLELELTISAQTPPGVNRLMKDGWHVSLPSEAEWEKAARGTDGRIYPWGNEPSRSRANYGGGSPKPVGSYAEGASPYGVLDMSGNVWEWTRSLYAPYPYNPTDGRENLQVLGGRVLRGGSFNNTAESIRIAVRNVNDPDHRGNLVGFRLVLSRQ